MYARCVGAHHTLRAAVGTVHRGFFAAGLAPVLTVQSGDLVDVTTLSGNQGDRPDPRSGFKILPEHAAVLDAVPPGEGPHLMTGPIAVSGAQPRDELIVEIVTVDFLQDWGWNLILPGMGALPKMVQEPHLLHVPIDRARGVVTMPWGLEIKTAPFFGIIGVAPPPGLGRVTSVIPGAFGGNIDLKHLGAGATLHLPVFNRDALLSVGDGHAVQGDGEVCLTAIETALAATLRVTLKKDTGIARPWAETPSHVITMAFDPDLNAAAVSAVEEMIKLIEARAGLSTAEAYTLCSIAADVHVTQLVNVHKGVHVMLRKDALHRA